MATRVAGDLYADIDGQMLEIKRQLRQRDGYPFDLMQLVEYLQAAIEGNFVDHNGKPMARKESRSIKKLEVRHVIDLDAKPFVPNGWQVEEHIKGGQFEWDPSKIALYLSESQKNGGVIQGNQLREELKGKPVFNANLLDHLFVHQELIPEEWKDTPVFFWGTIYHLLGGDLGVRYLVWRGVRWYWIFGWLDDGFSGDGPAAVPAST